MMSLLSTLSRSGKCPIFSGIRRSSTTPSLQLVAELRKRTNVAIHKARKALIASNGDILGALDWLDNDRITTGEQKAKTLGCRFAGEGLVGVSLLSQGTGQPNNLGVRAAMIELNCETDFVGRNDIFRSLVRELAFTAAFISDARPTGNQNGVFLSIDLPHLLDAPIMNGDQDEKKSPKTVSEAIRDAVVAVGENISIRRAVAFVRDPVPIASGLGLRAASYVHGSPSLPEKPSSTLTITEVQGQIGALVAIGLKTSPTVRLRELLQNVEFHKEMNALERAITRQIVGFRPDGVRGETGNALYNQTFDMFPVSGGQSVEKFLLKWAEKQGMNGGPLQGENEGGLEVLDFVRWEVGEGL